MNNIAENLLAEKKTDNLILFLTTSVEKNPDDPYNAYWLLMVAHTYLETDAPKIAEYYFERILVNCSDLDIKGKSIHLACLENLIKITDSPELQIRYYTDLITRFAQEIDLGYSYFMLARSYEKLGEWDLAIQTYTQFLSYGRYDILIPGVPDSYEYAKRIVDYNTSSKDWTFETLDELVTAIQTAISKYDYKALDKYRAEGQFFRNVLETGIERQQHTGRFPDVGLYGWKPHKMQRYPGCFIEPERSISAYFRMESICKRLVPLFPESRLSRRS